MVEASATARPITFLAECASSTPLETLTPDVISILSEIEDLTVCMSAITHRRRRN